MKRYLWDFAGPRAEGTAAHFREHLDEFLAREGLAGCETGIRSDGPGHWAAYCVAAAEAEDAIERALRPRRHEPA